MKKIFAFLPVILLATVSFAQITEQKISDKVKVTFPGKPEEQKLPNGAVAYSYKKDSTLAFMAMYVDLGQMGLTADVIASAGDALWEQMKGGMMAQLPGAVIVKDEITTLKGKNSLYLEIDGTNSAAPLLKGKKTFGYAFFVGAVLHQVTYYSSLPGAKASDAKAFFDSVVITD